MSGSFPGCAGQENNDSQHINISRQEGCYNDWKCLMGTSAAATLGLWAVSGCLPALLLIALFRSPPPGSLSWGFSAPTPAPENSYTPVPVLLYSTGWLCGQGSLWLGTQHSFNKEYWMWHLTHSLVSVLHFLRNYVQWWPIGKPSGYLFWMIHNCFPMHRKDWTTEPLRFRGVARNRAGR